MKSSLRNSKGFTVIEVTIVMAFVSVLILAVVFVTVYAGKMYAKGVTLKSLNQVGRDVSDSMRRDMSDANPGRVMYVATGTAPNQSGRLCLGSVSYVWNSASLLNAAPSIPKLKRGDGKDVHLMRVIDPSSRYCTNAGGNTGYPMSISSSENATEYLLSTDTELAVYSFNLNRIYNDASGTSSQGLFNVRMTLGTNEVGTTSASGSDVSCKAPSDNAANFDYCSVRDFEFVMRAGGSKQ